MVVCFVIYPMYCRRLPINQKTTLQTSSTCFCVYFVMLIPKQFFKPHFSTFVLGGQANKSSQLSLGVVAGNFGEVSEATHLLLAHLGTCRVRVAGGVSGRRGVFWAQGPGSLPPWPAGCPGSRRRRRNAAEVERRWRQEEQAAALARRYGRSFWHSGFARS